MSSVDSVGLPEQLGRIGETDDLGDQVPQPHSHSWSGIVLPWATLVVLMVLSVGSYILVRSDSIADTSEAFASRNVEIAHAIDDRMTVYTQALQGGLGLFRASKEVSRDEWQIYVESLDLDKRYPGIQGMGYAEWVQPGARTDYEARIRAEGFADFAIRPEGQREIYTSITYLEPFDERNRQAFGYDMFSQETRRSAMVLARDSGQVAISGKVTLVQEITSDVQAGFLMYLPYYGPHRIPTYAAERRAHSIGFVYSPFRMGDLMRGILGSGIPDVRLEIFDGIEISPETLMFDSRQQPAGHIPGFANIQQIMIGQRLWTIRTSSLPKFEELLDPTRSLFTLIAGLTTSMLCFGIIWSFARTRQRAQAMAAQMNVSLIQHSRKLTQSNEDLEQFAYIASHDLKAPLRGIDNLAAWIEEDLAEKLNGEPREHMNLLRGRVRRLESLLNDLLNYSRAGHVSSSIENVDLNELIETTWSVLNTGLGYSLKLDLQVEQRRIQTWAIALEQILINLLSNAIKHHDSEHGQVFVSVTEYADYFDFVVADDGPGIPVEHRDKVFQMFQTLRPRDDVEGSGMGLAIVRKFVERVGGRITIEERAGGRGVQIRFTWPKAPIRAAESTEPES